jgi:hypothetical protein
MPESDFDKLRDEVTRLSEQFEDLVIEFANIRRLIKERLAPDQIAKLEGLINEADRLAPLLKRLSLFRERTTEERLAEYGARPDQFAEIEDMDKAHTVDELRQKCRQLGLPTGGDKKELCFRLIKYGERQRNNEGGNKKQ